MFSNINFDTSLAPTPVTFSIPRRLRGDTVYGMSLWSKNFLKCNIKTLFVCSIFGFEYTLGCIMFRLGQKESHVWLDQSSDPKNFVLLS